MKTRYRFIHFINIGYDWYCYTNSKPAKNLGFCEFYQAWKQWQFVPSDGTAYTSECCRDIAHFLDQLKEQPK